MKNSWPNFVENFNHPKRVTEFHRDPKRAHFLAEVARSITSQTESFWVQNDRPTESYISIQKNMWRIKNDTASVRPKYSNSSLQKYPKMEKKFHPDEEKKIVIKTSSPFSERVVGHHFGSGLAMKKIIEFPSPKVGHLAFVSCNHLLKGLIFWTHRYDERTAINDI